MGDLIAIPGFAELQALTRGDSRIKIAVLDGPADLDRACFRGGNLRKLIPYWQEALNPIDPIYIQQWRQIRTLKDTKKRLEKQQDGDDTTATHALDAEIERVSEAIAQVTWSGSTHSHTSITSIFDTALKDADAPLRSLYHHLQALKQQRATVKQETPEGTDRTAPIQALEAEIVAVLRAIPQSVKERLAGIFHSTHVFGIMFGQPGTPVEGVAPCCTAINIPLFETKTVDEAISPLNLARAFNLALEQGVNIIHCAACHPTQTGFALEIIQRAVQQSQENNILVVAPAGNNKGEWFCVPAVLPNVLAVGMMKDNGQPADYSNWGGQYQEQGILAPGENILGGQPGTDEPVREEGTSCAAPVITGISALLMSVQLQRGEQPNAEAVRTAILQSAIPCDPQEVEEPEHCLVGKLNIPGAYKLLTGQPLSSVQLTHTVRPQIILPTSSNLSADGLDPATIHTSSQPSDEVCNPVAAQLVTASAAILADSPTLPSKSAPPNSSLTPSTITRSGVSNQVYSLGTVGYDFGSEARRDTFKQLMAAVSFDGTPVPANPYDARQMVDYLELSPAEGKSLIWTLNQELTPIYALEPTGAFANEIYATFQLMLAGQIQPESSDDYIERISIPGKLTDRTVELFSGQVVPVLELPNIRGMYGWQVNALVEAAIATVSTETSEPDSARMQRSLKSFLHRIYYDLRNLGQLDRDRALNFAATNAFQAATTFAEAVASGMGLEGIEIEKSPFCRLHSNCWDVKLKFFDSENSRRAKKVYRFTIDVANTMPVTLGKVRSWLVPR